MQKPIDLFIFDGKTEELLAILSNKSNKQCLYNEAKTEEQLNGDFTFEFSVPLKHQDTEHLIRGNYIAFKNDDKYEFFQIYKTEEDHTSEVINLKIICEHAVYELADDVVEDKRVINGTAQEAMEKALFNSRWQAGEIADLGLNTINFYYSNALQNIQDVINTFGGELHYRVEIEGNKIIGRFVDLLYRRGNDTGRRFTFNKDLSEVKRTVDFSGVKTALFGRGTGEETEAGGYTRKTTFEDIFWDKANGDPLDKPLGIGYLENPQALEKFGRENGTRNRFGIFDFDTTDPIELLNETYQELLKVSIPRTTYELKVVNLYELLGQEHLKVELGDTIFVFDKELNIELETRIIQLNKNLLNPSETEIILGNFIEDITNYTQKIDKIEAIITERKGVWDSSEEITDKNIADITPNVPTGFIAKGLFKSVIVNWDFDSSIQIASYELYASTIQGFTPDSSNLIFKGKSGGHLVESDTNTTLFFRLRAVSPKGTPSSFTEEFSAQTIRINTPDYEQLSIVDALIHSVSADKLTVGTIDAAIIDVINLTADNIVTGKLKAELIEIGAKTTFEEGYDPQKINEEVNKISDDGFVTLAEVEQLGKQLSSVYIRRADNLVKAKQLGLSEYLFELDKNLFAFNKIYENILTKKYGVNTGSIYTKAIWLWKAETVSTNADEIINVCKNAFINRIYVTYNTAITTDEQFAYFNKKAKENNIVVEALFGTPEWAMATHRQGGTDRIQTVINFNNSRVDTNEHFHGVHMDVEPYIMDVWQNGTIEQRSQLLREWLEGSILWADMCHSNEMMVSTSVPFWLETSSAVIEAQPEELEKPFYQLYFDLFDQVAMMSYRDDPTSILNLVKGELDYAVNTRKIIIGIEMTNQNDDQISYYEEGYNAFDVSSRFLHYSLTPFSGYAGIALHDYRQFKNWMDELTGGDYSNIQYPVELSVTNRAVLTSVWQNITQSLDILETKIQEFSAEGNIINNFSRSETIDSWSVYSYSTPLEIVTEAVNPNLLIDTHKNPTAIEDLNAETISGKIEVEILENVPDNLKEDITHSFKAIQMDEYSNILTIDTSNNKNLINPYQNFTGSVYVRASEDIKASIHLIFENNSNQDTGANYTKEVNLKAWQWVRLSVTGEAPVTAKYCYIQTKFHKIQPNVFVQWAAAKLEQGDLSELYAGTITETIRMNNGLVNDVVKEQQKKVLRIETNGSTDAETKAFKIDKGKLYKFETQIKIPSGIGRLYVGLRSLNSNNEVIPSLTLQKGEMPTESPTAYFEVITATNATEWHKVTGAVIPHYLDLEYAEGITKGKILAANPEAESIQIVFYIRLDEGEMREVFISDPIFRSLDAEDNLKLREDLKLSAPLPTAIKMNNEGITATTPNGSGFARLDHRGLYIFGGALQIEGSFETGNLFSYTDPNHTIDFKANLVGETFKSNLSYLATSTIYYPSNIPIEGGEDISFSLFAKKESGTELSTLRVALRYGNETGGYITQQPFIFEGITLDGWIEFKGTHKAPVNAHFVHLQMSQTAGDGNGIFVNGIMVVRGKILMGYSPHPQDQISTEYIEKWNRSGTFIDSNGVYTGLITFDQARGGVAILGGSNDQNGQLIVINADGEIIADLSAKSGGFEQLYIGQINSPSVYNVNSENQIIEVTSNLKNHLMDLPKINEADVAFRLMNNITENEVIIENFIGSGTITLDLNKKVFNGKLKIIGCSPTKIRIINGYILATTQGEFEPILEIIRSMYVTIEDVELYGSNQFYRGILVTEGSNCYIYNSDIYHTLNSCIAVSFAGQVSIQRCRGLSGSSGIHAFSGGYAIVSETIPNGTEQAIYNVTGVVDGTYTIDTGAPAPPSIAQNAFIYTTDIAASWLINENKWETGSAVQGTNEQGTRSGYWFFNDTLANNLIGKTIKSMRIFVKRRNEGGLSSERLIRIRHHGYRTQPTGQPYVQQSGEFHDIFLARGQSQWVNIPSSFFPYFQTGEALGFGVYVGENKNEYARLDNILKVEVVTE